MQVVCVCERDGTVQRGSDAAANEYLHQMMDDVKPSAPATLTNQPLAI